MEATITIKIQPPTDCTEQQFKEWLEFTLGERADISIQNPLHTYDFNVYDANGTIAISII
jgi:hypothetical protein